MTPGLAGPGPVFAPRPAPPFIPARDATKYHGSAGTSWDRNMAFGTSSGRGESSIPGPATLISFLLLWITPVTEARIPMPNFMVTVTPSRSDGANVDWQVQTASDAAFTTDVNLVTFLASTSGLQVNGTIGPYADLTTVYMRARAGSQSDNSWGLWATTVRVLMDSRVASATEHVFLNAGVFLSADQSATEHAYMNVGVFLLPTWTATEHVYKNVDTTTPSPYIYALRPTAGRVGDGVTLLGAGFGSSQAEYSGVVEGYNDASDEWTTLPVVSWVRVAASVDAATADRKIEPYTPDVDPEHDEIQVTVPSWAVPPAVPIRVRTDGA